MSAAKEKLLAAAVAWVSEHGIGELSLRQLATALGSSHRMLIYHFGSKEGLLVEVVREVERRQRAAFAELDPTTAPREFWRRLTDPALAPSIRLFFELYGQALQGRPGTTELLDGIVSSWTEPMTEWLRANGFPEDAARAQARLGLAVTRGLLLDLLATGDLDGVTAAMEAFLASTEQALRGHSSIR
ncbi:TetR/AcrR family transcriptional regulator [Crossiella sp. SN42]|uniref:TetR/AcrR family transcriptional regulator n=1 Tax=Crossiella sp. SN42 TaxID=2944808 RepID=UPI00207CF7AE|nr:TetR/AcrR family transcriptional regulator [Crossiella sp. SN42]MCO1577711.1 TetR/AcrR family transcriptional regulator [Crossiella sp. SN42]